MLVLSRRRNEKIVIGGNITVTVLDVRGDQVQLGIEAPRDIPVHRWEVFRAICAEDSKDTPEGDPRPDPGGRTPAGGA